MVKEVGVVLAGKIEVIVQIILGAAQILDADEVRFLLAQPVIKTVACGALDAVGTETDDPHAWPLAERACMII
jgi:hypothetical protein